MLTLEQIKEADANIEPEFGEMPIREMAFLTAILSKFYSNPVCFAGIFTGNDLEHFHSFFLKNSYKVHAYDAYPFLEQEDKITFQQYVMQRHSDKPYVEYKWSDVSKSKEQYSFIFNTAGYSCSIHNLLGNQNSPCVLLNAKGSSWHIFEHDFPYVFKHRWFDIFVNNDEAKDLFYEAIKENYVKLKQLEFHIVKVGKSVFGNLDSFTNYKKFIKSLSSDITSYSV